MLEAIVHHGTITDTVEYFATVIGPDLDHKFFFEQSENGSQRRVRYFGGGSEVILTPEGLRFDGNGGIFSEYMFGGHFPLRDLLNEEVRNRLVLFGGIYEPGSHELTFTANTSGAEAWETLFFDGNAVSNYIFFIDERRQRRNVVGRQERTLKAIGKLLKRSALVGRGNFLMLAREMHHQLDEPDSSLVLLRMIHRPHQDFYDACREGYDQHRSLEDLSRAVQESAGFSIDPYQRERIQIDVIYHNALNRELIDEYKRVLASCTEGEIGASERARLMRLRTLSMRNNIPLSIFDTLEEIVLHRGVSAEPGTGVTEPVYIQSTRAILEGFLLGRRIEKRLSSTDMVHLLENKQKAVADRDPRFEEILLETGRMIDESAREEEDFERMESFSELVTFFDRFDHTSGLISRLAFMDDVELTAEQVRSILGNMHIFEDLRRGLFRALFIDPIMENAYTLSFGRRKLYALMIGLMSVDDNQATLADVADEIRTINRHEKAYYRLYELARRRMSAFYLELNTAEGRATFRKEIVAESDRDPELAEVLDYIDDKLIEEVIRKIRLEAFYINQLLPRDRRGPRRASPEGLPHQFRPGSVPDRRARERVLRDAQLPAADARGDPCGGLSSACAGRSQKKSSPPR